MGLFYRLFWTKNNSRFIEHALCLFGVMLLCIVTSLGQSYAEDDNDNSLRPSFTFRAEWFSGGNMTPRGLPYSDKYVALSPPGVSSDSYADFEIDFPEDGDYELWAFYSAADSRPLKLEFDGTVVSDKALANTNGSWLTSASIWDKQVELRNVTAGKHTISIRASSPDIPHFSAFRLTPMFDMRTKWSAPRAIAKERILNATNWSPSPWSGGWYEYIARDRYQRKESGETFSNHFARESSWALAPKKDLTISASSKPLDAWSDEVDLFNELTYNGTMFENEGTSDIEKGNRRLFMKVSVLASQNDGNRSHLPKDSCFVVDASRFNDLLDRTADSILRFRSDCGEEQYLSRSFEKCQSLREMGKVAFDAYEKDPSKENVDLCASFYFDAVRLYTRVGWANPILDFDKLLFVQRHASDLGLPQNYQSNCVLNPGNFDDSLKTLKLPFTYDENNPEDVDNIISEGLEITPVISTLFKPDYPTFLGDLDLHFDAEKALISATDRNRRWNVFELDLNAALAQKSTDETMKAKLPNFPEADSYDACYMPDDSIIFTSTACYIGVPCVSGTTRVTNTYKLESSDSSIRRLTFDQEHNWCPTLTTDGRVMYLRWEYTDIPHVPGRLLFEMNPDGTNQRAYYGSNSLWPVSMMYARPIPGSTSKFCCVVTGHHGVSRMGELVLFDVQKGRKEAEGAIERICGFPKKVESRTNPKYHSTLWGDNIVDESWPKYLHPFPLSEEYYLVAAQPDRESLWGVYLVDRFDNMYLLAEVDKYACFEPVPWRETERPPVLADRVDLSKQDATVYCADVYYGDGLKNVPRGTVKSLRLYSYSYLYPNVGGATSIIGVDGPWDVRQVIGTVPVNEDGSALFNVPANVPIAIQPLDENGQALQQMRTWFTAMPGEFLSCVGCHEDENSTSSTSSVAFTTDQEVEPIRAWNGPMRGFSFDREVQPVLDHYCVACHDGQDRGWGVVPFDLRGGNIIQDFVTALQMGEPRGRCGKFSTSYMNLAGFVRRPGVESDYFLLNPMEFAANTTELVQILKNGHYGLQMDADAWDRIITWIDMNAPYHGTWNEFVGEPKLVEKWNRHRKNLLELYANFDDESEEARGEEYDPKKSGAKIELEWLKIPVNLFATDWERQILKDVIDGKRAFPDGNELRDRFEKEIGSVDSAMILGKPQEIGWEIPKRYDWNLRPQKTEVWGMGEPYLVPNDVSDNLITKTKDAVVTVETRAEEGTEIMTVNLSPSVSLILKKVTIGREGRTEDNEDLWIGAFEISNEQFETFDPEHDSRVESRQGLSHGLRGFFVNSPERSVCRVSWDEAVAFCRWLSEKTGRTFRLPTEDEWEVACLAGSSTPFYFGDWGADYSAYENFADQMLIEFIADNYFAKRIPLPNVTYYDDWVPKDRNRCDNGFLSEQSGRYKPNAWGLYDMHGNVSEWTSTIAKPNYGFDYMDSRADQRIVCGGSWRDRPYRGAASFRRAYYPWQRVFDVGFRVVCEDKVNK